MFCWLVLKKKPLTTNNLVKGGRTGDTACVLCRIEEKTVDHLFIQCVFSKFILVMGVEDIQDKNMGEDVISVWDRWKGGVGGQTTRHRLTGLVVCWWIIWKVSNDMIFRKIQLDTLLAIHKVKQLAKFWEQIKQN